MEIMMKCELMGTVVEVELERVNKLYFMSNFSTHE
jgi:hypothetical protein